MTTRQIVGLLWSVGALCSVPARAADPPAATVAPSPVPAGSPPLTPPLPPSPIAQFRQLLEATPEEQARELAARPERSRRVLEAKLREYQNLDPEERELRLRVTELRWYLRPLMDIPATNRVSRISSIPDDYRPLIEERLQQWDQLAPDARQDILQNEGVVQYFLYARAGTPAQTGAPRSPLPAVEGNKFAKELARWQTLPADRRQRMCTQFKQFFELPRAEQQKTLHALPAYSAAERQEMEQTLQAFAQLPRRQRDVCVASFRKFAALTDPERAEFLRNADRWRTLTPKERQTWRKLVANLPPLPPRPSPAPPRPPAPPPAQSRLAATSSPPAVLQP